MSEGLLEFFSFFFIFSFAEFCVLGRYRHSNYQYIVMRS